MAELPQQVHTEQLVAAALAAAVFAKEEALTGQFSQAERVEIVVDIYKQVLSQLHKDNPRRQQSHRPISIPIPTS